ncbi:response regulator transcription factor [Aquibacillus rhizosphaerae]|uniref:Response regulator n=1 Tax=Aquibacillus rhizosphaerae TaxID=3051431 RepID=A0ABT7L877_9BACI|nr:helix-turn-helix domain-containing protein [Aquibacillus sp. LR5S19]MDL4842070.1 response regulator [Aquibacillus sp. LR5S19]
MYQVVLVDDDVMVLEFMTKMIPWQDHGFEIIASFHDSLEALQYMKTNDFDVLITDIGMPHLNGIDLLGILRAENIKSINIILSCHDEFHFAQQALKLDAYDYILKESMEEPVITDLLTRLIERMDEELKEKTNNKKIGRFLNKNNRELKSKFIEKVVDGNVSQNEVWWEEQEELLGMNFHDEKFTPVLCYIDYYQDVVEKYKSDTILQFSINNIIEEELKNYQQDIQIFYLQGKFFVLFKKESNSSQLENQLIDKAIRNMQEKLETYLKITTTIVIGNKYQDKQGLITSMQELLDNNKSRFYYPHNSLQALHIITFNEKTIFHEYQEVMQKVKTLILERDDSNVFAFIEEYISVIRNGKFHPNMVLDFAVKLVLDIKLSLNTLMRFKDDKLLQMTNKIMNVDTITHLEITLIEIFTLFLKHVHEFNQLPRHEEVLKAQIYVRQHINQKMSLKDVAAYLHLNASYFSRLFKQETGENFIEYVTRIKMEQATGMIENTKKSIDQIANELGFESKSYFLKTFKKQTGMSPRHYKYKLASHS